LTDFFDSDMGDLQVKTVRTQVIPPEVLEMKMWRERERERES
jgi:hypothetical protein